MPKICRLPDFCFRSVKTQAPITRSFKIRAKNDVFENAFKFFTYTEFGVCNGRRKSIITEFRYDEIK